MPLILTWITNKNSNAENIFVDVKIEIACILQSPLRGLFVVNNKILTIQGNRTILVFIYYLVFMAYIIHTWNHYFFRKIYNNHMYTFSEL